MLACSFLITKILLHNITNPWLVASQIQISPPAPNLSIHDSRFIVYTFQLGHCVQISQLLQRIQTLDQSATLDLDQLSPAPTYCQIPPHFQMN